MSLILDIISRKKCTVDLSWWRFLAKEERRWYWLGKRNRLSGLETTLWIVHVIIGDIVCHHWNYVSNFDKILDKSVVTCSIYWQMKMQILLSIRTAFTKFVNVVKVCLKNINSKLKQISGKTLVMVDRYRRWCRKNWIGHQILNKIKYIDCLNFLRIFTKL